MRAEDQCHVGVIENFEAALADPSALFGYQWCDELGGPAIDTGTAYSWAKHGVHRFVRREAVRLGPAGARICSVSPGIIDTPRGSRKRRAIRRWPGWSG